MKIIISGENRVQAFNLASQLYKKGVLLELITSDPFKRSHNLGEGHLKRLWLMFPFWCLERFFCLFPSLSRFLVFFNFLQKKMYDFLTSIRLQRLMRKNPDIFIVWSGNGLNTIKKANKLGIKTITYHGSAHPVFQKKIVEEECKKFGCPSPYTKEYMKIIKILVDEFKYADYVIVPSSFVIRTFVSEGIHKDHLLFVPYGVDRKIFKKVKKRDDKFRIIFCGHLSYPKGVHYLLRAFHELDLPNSELVLIGAMEPNFKKMADRFCRDRDNIKILGPKFQSSLFDYYSQGSVFVHPSIQEGFGLVILEAMACGLPVICTENGGGPDIIRDGKEGFIIPIRNVDLLKKKMLFLYNNPKKLKEMAKLSYKRIDDFSTKRYSERLIKALNGVN